MDDIAEELFCDLMELPSRERMAALEEIQDLPDQLKADVRRMLKDAEEAEKYFTGTSVATKIQPASFSYVEKEGSMCGPYRLERKLGEGGFGVVWEAVQEKPLKRTVAVKVIKAGMDTDEVLARFDAEKQALARMEHPNIAKVLDAGMTENGRPYFAMELVEGIPITRYCHEHDLSTRERLRLFIDICSALNHAHQKGVIHRDIKPSNVIVSEIEGSAVVKVIDFGIAKAIDGQLTDHTFRTRVEQWIGTPAYMSPEQASLEITDLDTRSDIYTLGILLYELITGVTPFDAASLQKAGYAEMRRIIREEEPPRPSIRIATETRKASATGERTNIPEDVTVRGIASELDWVVIKAIEKSRDRRYETAAALADDIGRYLADEPVEARPPSKLYTFTKFARRHRLGIYIGSAFLLLITGVVILSVWLAIRARDAENVAQESLIEMRKERDFKNKALQEARKERDSKNAALEEAESVSRLLGDVFQRPQPGVDGRSVTVLEALDTAAQKLDSQLITQPKRRAKLRGVLAATYESLGIFDRSVKLRLQNYETSMKTSGANHEQTKEALRKVVEAAEAKGDSKLALKYAQLERDSLQETNASAEEIETAMRSLIRGLFGVGKRKLAIEHQRELIAYSIEKFGVDSSQHVKSEWELRQYEAGTLDTSATDKQIRIKLMTLEKNYAELVQTLGSMHTKTIEARTMLASKCLSAGHTLEALLHLRALQANTMKLFGPRDDRTLGVQRKLVTTYIILGREVDAVRLQQAIVNVLRERDGLKAQTTVSAEYRLKRRYHYSNLGKEREAYYKDLLERRIKTFGKDHPNTLMLRLVFDPNNVEESLKDMKSAVDQLRKNHARFCRGGTLCRTEASAVVALARAYVSAGRVPDAMPYYEKCTPSMLDDTWANFEYATFQLWKGDTEGYRKTRSNIINYSELSFLNMQSSPDILDRAIWLSCIAEIDDDAQKVVIQKLLNHAQNIRKGLHVEAEERFPKQLRTQIKGVALYRLGRYKEAQSAFQKAMSVINFGRANSNAKKIKLPNPWVLFFMAMNQHHLGNKEEAVRLLHLGESKLHGDPPSKENPAIKYFVGGETLTHWIMRREAEALISEP